MTGRGRRTDRSDIGTGRGRPPDAPARRRVTTAAARPCGLPRCRTGGRARRRGRPKTTGIIQGSARHAQPEVPWLRSPRRRPSDTTAGQATRSLRPPRAQHRGLCTPTLPGSVGQGGPEPPPDPRQRDHAEAGAAGLTNRVATARPCFGPPTHRSATFRHRRAWRSPASVRPGFAARRAAWSRRDRVTAPTLGARTLARTWLKRRALSAAIRSGLWRDRHGPVHSARTACRAKRPPCA